MSSTKHLRPRKAAGPIFLVLIQTRGKLTTPSGRTFAEREILWFTAAIFAMWEIVPSSGRWDPPGSRNQTGTQNPRKDVRVKIRRRQVAH